MLTLEKSRGLTKLGSREKRILLLMLKGDEPPGKPNPIWFDIYGEFGINYNSFPKKYQPKFREEKNIRLSILRLSKKDLVRPVSVVPEGSSLPDPRGYGYIFYSLTQTGRATAERLKSEEKALKIQDDLEKIMLQLRALSAAQVTIGQVRELLWQQSQDKFVNMDEFDRYWNNTKLGIMLKKYSFGRTQVSMKDGRRKYRLMT